MDVVLIPLIGFAVAFVARMIRPLAVVTPFARLATRAVAGATLGGLTGLALLGNSTTLHHAVTASDVTWLAVAILSPLIFFVVHDAASHRSALPPLVGKGWRWGGDERQVGS